MTCTAATTSSTNCRTGKSTHSTNIFPASIFDRSRISLIKRNRDLPFLATVSTYSRCSSGERSGLANRSVKPRMAVMGVRISWLMLVRNSVFARLAASA